jgi:hypothetical protein
MTLLTRSTPPRRGLQLLWGWVALVALTQMGMDARGCFSAGDGDDGGSSAGSCELGGKHYAHGETFRSPDDCNTCWCGPSGISCTLMGCMGNGAGGGAGPGGGAGAGGGTGVGGSTAVGGSAGVGGTGAGGGGDQCNAGAGCLQVPCACIDEDGDSRCDNHCPVYECIGGQCVDVTPRPTICGGLLGTSCPDGEYCKFLPSTRCGSGDQTGECTPKAEVCADIYSPVCGCDGETYSSGCSASAAGVSVKATGECPSPGTLGLGESCGGFVPPSAPTCDQGLFCQHQPGALCGAADAPGECVEIPASCPTTGEPVCGCDGISYANACAAARAQVGIFDVGRCK